VTKRSEQVASVLHRAVQGVLSEGLSDPRLSALITVTSIKVSPDLSEAVVNVSVVPEEREALALHGLRDASGHIRRRASEMVRMRRLPRLLFKADKSLKREARVLTTLRELSESQAGAPAESEPRAEGAEREEPQA